MSDRADATAMMRAGHLLVVRSLLRVLPNSTHAKAALDAVVDACAAMQNLRSIIVRYRGNMLKEPREDKRAKILSVVTVRLPPAVHLAVRRGVHALVRAACVRAATLRQPRRRASRPTAPGPRVWHARSCRQSTAAAWPWESSSPSTARPCMQDHIDRYCHLIVFCSYLSAPAVGDDGGRQPFAAFLGALPEVKSVMERLLWAFPMLTLELDGESGRDMMTHSEKVLEARLSPPPRRSGPCARPHLPSAGCAFSISVGCEAPGPVLPFLTSGRAPARCALI